MSFVVNNNDNIAWGPFPDTKAAWEFIKRDRYLSSYATVCDDKALDHLNIVGKLSPGLYNKQEGDEKLFNIYSNTLDEIAELLDGKEWEVENLETIAALVSATGRYIREPFELVHLDDENEQYEADHEPEDDGGTCSVCGDDLEEVPAY